MEMETCPSIPPASNSAYLQKFRLYETRSHFYMIGRDKSRTVWKVLKIDRSDQSQLNILEDSTSYSESECCDLLRRIHEGNKGIGGLKFVTVCYGVVGFIKFLGPYYMLLITERRKIGAICGHSIYAITRSEMIPVPVQSNMTNSKNENRSFVHSACKWNKYLVLLRRLVRLVLKNTHCFFVTSRGLSDSHDCFLFHPVNCLGPIIWVSCQYQFRVGIFNVAEVISVLYLSALYLLVLINGAGIHYSKLIYSSSTSVIYFFVLCSSSASLCALFIYAVLEVATIFLLVSRVVLVPFACWSCYVQGKNHCCCDVNITY